MHHVLFIIKKEVFMKQKNKEVVVEQNLIETKKVVPKKQFNFDTAGAIFLILGAVILFVGLLPTISLIAIAIYYLILIVILILSVFTLLANEQFMGWFSGGENITNVINAILPVSPYIMFGSVALFATAIVMYAFSKHKNAKIAGIVISSVLIIGAIVGGVLILNLT
jgi:uncharacterized membrane protein